MHVPRSRSIPCLFAILLAVLSTAATPRPESPSLRAAVERPTPAGPGSGQPCLAVSPQGRVWMSWIERREGGGHRLLVAALEGPGAGTPRLVVEGDALVANGASFPALAVTGPEALAVAWGVRTGEDGASDLRIAASRDGGRTWTTPAPLHHDGTPTEHGFVRLAAEAGGVRAVWLDGRNGTGKEEGAFDMTVRTARMDAAGRVGADRLLDPRACDCCPIGIAATPRGTVVAWRDRSREEVRDIAAARLAGDRAPTAARVPADRWTMPGCPVNGPALAARGERAAIAWFTGADSGRVRVAFSHDAGRRFGEAVRVDEGNAVGRADVALLDDGSAVVAWLESAGDGVALRARRAAPDAAPGAAITVASLPSLKGVGMPRMMRAGDTLVFAWTEPGPTPRVRLAECPLR